MGGRRKSDRWHLIIESVLLLMIIANVYYLFSFGLLINKFERLYQRFLRTAEIAEAQEQRNLNSISEEIKCRKF